MHAAGVTCSDCHDPHALAPLASGNQLCTRCHSPTVYDAVEHNHHPTAATACVDCHMRSETYMLVDARRDHSFRVPRPDLSVALGTPNACNDCHREESADWAMARVLEWFPNGRNGTAHFATAFAAAENWSADRSPALRALILDPAQSGIVRATAVRMLARQLDAPAAALVRELVRDSDPLVQLAAIDAAQALSVADRVDMAQRFLSDERLVFRAAAARVLLPARSALSPARRADLDQALDELLDSLDYGSDRPEGIVSRAELLLQMSRADEAEAALETAVARYPWYAPAWLNLADLARGQGRETDALERLQLGIAQLPDSAPLRLAQALALVRQQDLEPALLALETALELDADDPYLHYVYGIALNSVGDTDRALAQLAGASERFPGYRDLLFALATISRDRGLLDAARGYAAQLLVVAPGDAEGLALETALAAAPGGL
jgi:tetratricopeptide (TPR) repeat protein